MICYPIGNSGQRLVFHSAVVKHLLRYRQCSCRAKEAGGQLFAIFEGEEIHIIQATGPRPTDRRRRHWYIPDRVAEQNEIYEHFQKGLHFVGDWHSHPEPKPKPSAIDIASARECVIRSTHQLRGFVSAIVGTAPFPEGLFVGIVSSDGMYPLDIKDPYDR